MTISNDSIKAGDFLIVGFGKGTQGVKVIGTSAKRLEIIRCQQYLSDNPFWTGAISKISRTDPRILRAWAVPSAIEADAPSDEEIAETKIEAAHKAACSKAGNLAGKPFKAEREAFYAATDFYNLTGAEQQPHQPMLNALRDQEWEANSAACASYCAEHGRTEWGKKV